MGLRTLVIPTELVKVSDSDGFTVRGLSTNDALSLYSRHPGELSGLFDKFTGAAKTNAETDITKIAATMISGAPQIIAEIIVLASGGVAPTMAAGEAVYEEMEANWRADLRVAMQLSTGVQMDALERTARLTFTSDMPPKKFLGLVLQMAGSATAVLENKPRKD